MRRFFIVPLVVLLISGLAIKPASGCPIGFSIQPDEALKEADAAFIGVRYKQSDVEIPGSALDTKVSFLVEWAVKGSIDRRVDVFMSKGLGGCPTYGAVSFGERIGVVLSLQDGRWVAGFSNLIDADELLSAAEGGTVRKLGSAGYFQAVWLRAQSGSAPIVLGTLMAMPLTLVGVTVARRRRLRRRVAWLQRTP